MTETLAYGYSSESTQQEMFNEYQHDRVKMVLTNICVLMHWMKVASALKGLSRICTQTVGIVRVLKFETLPPLGNFGDLYFQKPYIVRSEIWERALFKEFQAFWGKSGLPTVLA